MWHILALLMLLCSPCLQARELVRDTIIASHLQAEQIVLDGPTTILVDQNSRLTSITGNHPLEIITFEGTTLTVDDCHDQAYAVDVTGLRLTGDGMLLLTGKHNGLNLNGGDLCCSQTHFRVEARNGVSHWQDGCAITGASNITIENSDVWIYGANVGIANAGNITISGVDTRCYISGCHGIATLSGNNEQPYYGTDSLTITDADVCVTSLDGSGVVAHSVRVNGGSLDVSQTGGNYQNCALSGSIDAVDCSLTLNAEKMAIDATAADVRFHNCAATVTSGDNSRAIQAQQLTITGTDSSTVRITAGHEAIYCLGDLTIDNHSVLAISHGRGHMAVNVQGNIHISMHQGMHDFISTVLPIRAGGQLNMLRPYKVNDNAANSIDAADHAFATADGQAIMGRIHLSRPSLQDWHVQDTTGLASFSLGQCTAKSLYLVGEEVTVQLPQSLLNFVNCSATVPSIEWYRSTAGIASPYVRVGEGHIYATTAADAQQYLYAKVQFDTHDNSLLTHPVAVMKHRCDSVPEKPQLTLSQNRIWVTNPMLDQEYMVLNTFKSVASLRDADWVTAQSPADTLAPLRLQGSQGAVNYVYTRFRETSDREAGRVVLQDAIFYGTSDKTKKVNFTITGVNCTVTDDVDGMKNVPLGGVVRINASPLPTDATDFAGIAGWNWMLTGGTTRLNESGYGMLYVDSLCLKPIAFDSQHRYTSVYALLDKPTESNHAVMYVYRNSTESYTSLLNVSNADSTYELATITAADGSATIAAGSSTVIALDYKPVAASLQNLAFALENTAQVGELPTLFFNPDSKSLTIDASHTPSGFSGRYAIRKGTKKVDELTLHVVTPPCDSLAILTPRVTIHPQVGECRLDAVFTPANAQGPVKWTSSDTSKATVDSTGHVQIAHDENLVGDTVLITAKSGDCIATTIVRIGGDLYPVWIDRKQVSSANQADVLRDGALSLCGHVLTLDDASLAILNSNLNPLFIKLNGQNRLKSDFAFSGRENVIVGSGNMVVGGGNEYALHYEGRDAATLHVAGGVSLDATNCRKAGIIFPQLRVTGEETKVAVAGQDPLVVDEFWGSIVAPAGAQWLDGLIVDADNNPIHNQQLVITGAEVIPLPTGDVNRDRRVNVSDITSLVNMILGLIPMDLDAADVDGSGRVNVSDVTALINIILK